ncbi:IS4 family transposase [Synechococcus sp. PCC 7336]|uniref:IS4 family transposase n=1 Tax=Synechococcus sp. PCC 7336 TaxID=195250 RepID=UPI00036EC48F|nr:IS4 family transposase [Synechococcus sp. PCC 7336]
MSTIFVVCGKVNYTNLSRYSELSERTYRRHFEQGLGLERLNQTLIEQVSSSQSNQIAVVDCNFVEKSGRHTPGLDWFYNGKTQRAERGLEWSVVAIVDLEQNTGYTLSAQQTEAGLASQADTAAPAHQSRGNRVDFYLGHLAYCQSYFPPQLRYVVGDGYYTKDKWVEGVVQLKLHAIGKLRRCDANLNFLYDGPQKPRGRHRRYDGKVDLTNPSRFEFVGSVEFDVKLYTAVVWSVCLKRSIRLAYLLKEQDGKRSYVVLFSTDLEIDPLLLYRCYKARFQIEFIFRDARQFTGLADCQARSPEALDSHINTSLMALNLAKAALQQQQPTTEPLSFSIASYKRLALNEHLLDLFISMFELEPSSIKSHPSYQNLLGYGAIAA